MSLDYNIRSFQPGEETKLVELLKVVFHDWPHFNLICSPLDHWLWKYKDNPQGRGWVTVAEVDGKLIGCFHLYLNRTKVGSKIFLSMQSADAGVLSDYQGRGVFTKLYSSLDTLHDASKVGLHYGVSMNVAVHKTTKKDPKRNVYQFSTLVRINDINSYVKPFKFFKRVRIWSGFYALKVMNAFTNFFRASSEELKEEIKISEVKEFDERIDDFWDGIKNSYNFITVLNREYLNWRYCDPRGGEYIIRQAEENGRIIGFIVFRINSFGEGPPRGYVVGLYTLPGSLYCAEVLLDDALKFFDEHKINIINYGVGRGHTYAELFRIRGFLDTLSGLYVTIRNRNIDSEFDVFMNSPPDKVLFQYGEIDWI